MILEFGNFRNSQSGIIQTRLDRLRPNMQRAIRPIRKYVQRTVKIVCAWVMQWIFWKIGLFETLLLIVFAIIFSSSILPSTLHCYWPLELFALLWIGWMVPGSFGRNWSSLVLEDDWLGSLTTWLIWEPGHFSWTLFQLMRMLLYRSLIDHISWGIK